MDTTLPAVQRTAFSASSVLKGPLLELRLEGNADTEVVTDLAAYLSAVHAAAQDLGVKEVVVDFHSLYFMTSSCFKCFLAWISSIEDLEASTRYAVRLEANSNLHWQARSFDALRAFATNIVTLHA